LKIISQIQRPAGLYFTDLSLERQDSKIKVIISGFSKDRESVLTFKQNIESESKINNLSFSQESWIKPIDVNFHLTFEILKDETQK
jgi:hypothetical protein